jgi:hypothetical protein
MILLSRQIGHIGKTDGVRPFASKTTSRRQHLGSQYRPEVPAVRDGAGPRLGQYAIADRTVRQQKSAMAGMMSDEIYRTQQFGQRTGFGKRPALLVVDFVNGFADPQLLGGAT